MNHNLLSDTDVLEEIGGRVSRRRIDFGLTQAELASQAGVGRATVERLEAGKSTQLTSFIRVLRVLGLIDVLLQVLPNPGLRPLDLVRLQKKQRQRAPGRRRKKDVRGKPWVWADEE